MTETHYCWMDPNAFPGRLIVPRGDPMKYEDAADLLFATIDEAEDWRAEELDSYRGDSDSDSDTDEINYIQTWVLCRRTVETVRP